MRCKKSMFDRQRHCRAGQPSLQVAANSRSPIWCGKTTTWLHRQRVDVLGERLLQVAFDKPVDRLSALNPRTIGSTMNHAVSAELDMTVKSSTSKLRATKPERLYADRQWYPQRFSIRWNSPMLVIDCLYLLAQSASRGRKRSRNQPELSGCRSAILSRSQLCGNQMPDRFRQGQNADDLKQRSQQIPSRAT